MRRVTELLVPQGTLVVEQVFQEITADPLGEIIALWESCRASYLDGEPVWWGPDTRDLLDAAADALALLPPPVDVPLVGAGR